MAAAWEFLSGGYAVQLYILIGIYLLLAQSFNLTFGAGRIFNLAHISVYAIGAYTTAILSTDYALGFVPCVAASMLLSGLFSLLIGGIALKLAADYFAIGTLAFAAVVSAALVNWKSVTHGVLGIPGIPRPRIGSFIAEDNASFVLLLYGCVVITHVFFLLLLRSPYGRTLRAQAESETAALSLGKRTIRDRTLSFVIASSVAGLAGSFFAYFLNFIDPSSFSLAEMVFLLTIVIVGRPGSFWGVIGATVFLVLLPEPLRFVELPLGVLGPARQLLQAMILFTVLYFNRSRLFPPRRVV